MDTLDPAEKRYNKEYLLVDSLWAFHRPAFSFLDRRERVDLLAYYPQIGNIGNAFDYRRGLLREQPSLEVSGRKALYKLMCSLGMDIDELYETL